MLEVFEQSPHRRWNPLRREWVLASPHRTQRPWQGQTEENNLAPAVEYDPSCYLCPGNVRAGGHLTPTYTGTFVFENDYAALKDDVAAATMDIDKAGLLRAETERGICRVLCFSPRHDLTLATMRPEAIRDVVEEWVKQETELAAHQEISYVQIFENRGSMMGASNPHPHGQIWATEHIPNEPSIELAAQRDYLERHGRTLLLDYLQIEVRAGERIVAENATWVALVPFWAVWPFEIMLLPKTPSNTLRALDAASRTGLADLLKTVTAGYNRVFDAPFPYSMGFHAAPCDSNPHPEWQLHAHFFPPLLRSATVRKFMVGFELLGSPQRDITSEVAAQTLRDAVDRADEKTEP
jgi:UDPglucose--hexose-1-phosphate uridylyltransferase